MKYSVKKYVEKVLTKVTFSSSERKNRRLEWQDKYQNIYYGKLDKIQGESVEPWALIRAKNEISTIKESLESIVPVIKKGVIGYNDCTDGTDKVILEFCKKNKGFIPVKYTHEVFWIFDERNKERKYRKNMMHTYSNYILSFIPQGEWVIKLDCDHIYDKTILKKILAIPKNNNDCICFPKFNILDCIEGEVYLDRKKPFVYESDYWLLKNDDLKFYQRIVREKEGNVYYEHVSLKRKNKIQTVNFNYHFPLLKNRKSRKLNEEDIISLKEWKEKNMDIIGIKISEDMLNEKRIIEIYNKLKK